MFQDLRILAVIPARGGSKGIPKKNIAMLAGRPLISYTTELCQSMAWIDATVVSTDSAEIAAVALKTPGITIVSRPEELSGDRIGDHPVLVQAIDEAERTFGEFDAVIMLQPTSPLRTVHDVESCLARLAQSGCDAVWTVSETELTYHPRKQLMLSEGGGLSFVIPGGESIIARQQLEPVYHRNGVCYAFRRDFLAGGSSIFSESNTTAIVTRGRHISIDTPEDLAEVEELLAQKAK